MLYASNLAATVGAGNMPIGESSQLLTKINHANARYLTVSLQVLLPLKSDSLSSPREPRPADGRPTNLPCRVLVKAPDSIRHVLRGRRSVLMLAVCARFATLRVSEMTPSPNEDRRQWAEPVQKLKFGLACKDFVSAKTIPKMSIVACSPFYYVDILTEDFRKRLYTASARRRI